MAEFDSGVIGGELPVDLALVGIGCFLPGGELIVEGVEVVDPAVEALSGERGQFDFGDFQPSVQLSLRVGVVVSHEGQQCTYCASASA